MIIDRYMIREVGAPLVAVVAVLLTIFTTYSLTRYLVDASSGLLLPREVLQLTLLRALVSLEVLLPLSLYLAVMIGMGRLYSDSEIYAMRSSGISEHRLLRPVVVLALTLAVAIAVFSLSVRPWAYAQSYRIQAAAAATSETDRIRAARFYRFEDSGRTVFVNRIVGDGRIVEGVFVQTRKEDGLQVITADSGELEYDLRPGYHRLTLFDVRMFKKIAGAPDLFADLGTFALWLPRPDLVPVGYRTKASPTLELATVVAGPDRAELQWRLSTPLSTLLLALLAIPLSRGRPRQGRYARILLALVIYAVYFNALDVSRTWVEQEAARTIWWVPGILLLLVVGLFLPWRKLRYIHLRTMRAVAGGGRR